MGVGTTNTKRHRPNGLFVGLSTLDLAYVVDEIPTRNAKISVPSQHISAGGPAANAAVTFAFLGGRSALVTAVGKHPLGTAIRRDLHHFLISVHDIAHKRKEAPPVSSILVLRGSGERTVISANATAFPPINLEFNPRWLTGISIVQVDGHYMPLCIDGARLGRSRGIPVVLDSGSWKEGMAELLHWIDIAICSDDYRPPGCRDNSVPWSFWRDRGSAKWQSRVVLPRSSTWTTASGARSPSNECARLIPSEPAMIFHGAFCYYTCQMGRGFRASLAFAAHVATASCLHLGSRSWMEAFSPMQAIRN